jgi:hypothetical protein
VSARVAEEFSHRAAGLSLPRVRRLDDDAANVFASFKSPVSFDRFVGPLAPDGLTEITASALAKLRKNPNITLPESLRTVDSEASSER